MVQLLFAILSSASMALVLKLFRGQRGNRYGLLLGNYLTCVLIALLSLPDRGQILRGSPTTLLLGLGAGVLFVAGLITLQSSVRLNGATLSAAFAKLGLLVSLALSVLCFGERPGLLQLLGILLVLAALVLIHTKGGEKSEGGAPRSLSLLLLTLLAGGGADAMAKVFEQLGRPEEDRLYFLYLFLTAALLTGLLALLERRRSGKRILLRELAAGVAVGVPNYFSSYLLLLALEQLPAFLVYPVFSTGTILLVLLLSALLFRERPGRRQLLGILLILGLELFCDAFTGRHLLYQLKKHSFSLFVQIGKISVQRAGGQQLRVQRLAVLPEIPQMPLAPNADGPLFFSGQLQTWNVIIALQLVPKAIFLVVDVLFHDVILQI